MHWRAFRGHHRTHLRRPKRGISFPDLLLTRTSLCSHRLLPEKKRTTTSGARKSCWWCGASSTPLQINRAPSVNHSHPHRLHLRLSARRRQYPLLHSTSSAPISCAPACRHRCPLRHCSSSASLSCIPSSSSSLAGPMSHFTSSAFICRIWHDIKVVDPETATTYRLPSRNTSSLLHLFACFEFFVWLFSSWTQKPIRYSTEMVTDTTVA